MPAPLLRACPTEEPQAGGRSHSHSQPAPSSSSSSSSLWSGHERLRIGERLQACLAGLWELELLRGAQGGAVERALPPAPPHPQEGQGSQDHHELPPSAKLDRSQSEDLLGTPKKSHRSYRLSESVEDHSSLLHGCTGDGPGKGCLGSQTVSEQLLLSKKAGVGSGGTQELLEADSRPSSGFYETSEMGSLSDSCASVHSDGPGGSRGSLGSLCHLPGLRENSFVRPRSTDEAAVRLLDLQLQQLALGGGPGADSRRPVSTGDLELLLGLGDVSLPLGRRPSLQLPRYKSDLVSRNTHEVYHYPSPLHAVALQSPLFTSSLSQSSSQEDLGAGAGGALVAAPAPGGSDPPQRAPRLSSPEQRWARLDRYIATLVLRHKCRSASSRTSEPIVAGGLLAGGGSSGQKSLSLPPACSSALGPAPGWRVRRRISTCSHLRSPEGSEGGTRDSQVLDSPGELPPFLEIGSGPPAGTSTLSKASEPSVLSLPDPEPLLTRSPHRQQPSRPAERGLPGWAARAPLNGARGEAADRKEASLPRAPLGWEQLYKGKHASRDLVKAAERQQKPAERSWLSPRELLRRLSLRRRPSAHVGSGRARASSEINLPVAAAAGLLSPADPQAAGKGRAGRPKWASVLEISSKAPGRPRLHGGPFQPPPGLSCPQGFSPHSAALILGGSHLELPARQRAHFGGGSSSSSSRGARLGEVEATSAISLNGDWFLHHLGEPWPPVSSATLDSAELPVAAGSFKLRRSRSFKELKRMVTRSLKGARART